jgi:hypothetical protein
MWTMIVHVALLSIGACLQQTEDGVANKIGLI